MSAFGFFVTLAFLSTLQLQIASAGPPIRFSDDSTPVMNCAAGENAAEIHRVSLNGCTAMAPCPLIKGSNGKMEIEFTPKYSSSQMSVGIRGIISRVPVPWSVPGGNDVCPARMEAASATECAQAGKRQKFEMSLPILSSYPSIVVVIDVRLKDAEDRTQVCLKMRAKLTSG